MDHFVCSTKGQLFSGAGRTNPDHMYCGGCVFVYQSSGFVHTEFQSSSDAHQTLKAKEGFELRCLDYGVRPQAYVTDQGAAFTSHDFRDASLTSDNCTTLLEREGIIKTELRSER